MALIAWAATETFMRDRAEEQTVQEIILNAGYTLEELFSKSESEIRTIIQQRIAVDSAIWFAVIGGLIGLGLGSVEGIVTRSYSTALRAGVISGVIGFLGGGVAGFVAQIMYSSLLASQEETSMSLQILARTIGWGVAGMLLGLGQGLSFGSAKKIRNGLLGGLAGGLVGGFLFDPISMVAQNATISRLIGLCVIGGATGAMISLVESLLKDAWLRVVAGPLTGKQFIVYKNPTNFGSAPKADLYLFNDGAVDPFHAALHTTPQGYVLQDNNSSTGTFVNGQRITQHHLRPNDLIQIGQYHFTYGERQRQVPQSEAWS